MQIIFKIGEFKPKKKADLINVFKYITRESAVYKAKGIGVSNKPDIAVRQFMINKRKHKKAVDEKYRFAYHEILSFEAGTDPELAYKIAEDYCKNLHHKKGFNSYFSIQTDTDNVHAHIIVDSVNFKTGNMLISENEKELEKRPELKNKIEFYSLEQQMKFAEDMAIKNGYEIEDEKRYEAMHEAKKTDKNARKWLTKNQYQAFKKEQVKDEDKSWRNVIKGKIEAMYKRADITEQNIAEIAKEYGLEVTRHNIEKKTITFALLDNEGKRTKQRLKLVEQLNKKKKKGEDEVAEENIKLAIKMERLEEQERGNFANEDMNIFTYSNFFRNREKEKDIEQIEQDNKELLKIFDITSKDKELEKEKVLEKEKELHSTSKEEIIAVADEKPSRIDNKPKIFERLKDFKNLRNELEYLEMYEEVSYSGEDFEKNFADVISVAFYSIIKNDILFNNKNEVDRANEIINNIKEQNNTNENIRRNIELLNQLKLDNKKEYERLEKERKKSYNQNVNVEVENIEEVKKDEEDKSVSADKLTTNNTAKIETSKQVSVNKPIEIPNIESGKTVSSDLLTKEIDKSQDLEKSIKRLYNNYPEIIEKYNLYENLPEFKVYSENGNEIFNNKTGYIAEDYIISVVGQEFWDNMQPFNLYDWDRLQDTGVEIQIEYTDKNGDWNWYTDYTDYAEETVINYLKEHKEEIAKLEREFNSKASTVVNTKDKGYVDDEVEKGEKEYEYGQ